MTAPRAIWPRPRSPRRESRLDPPAGASLFSHLMLARARHGLDASLCRFARAPRPYTTARVSVIADTPRVRDDEEDVSDDWSMAWFHFLISKRKNEEHRT